MEQRPPDEHDDEPEIDLHGQEARPQEAAPAAGLPVIYFAEEVIAEMKRHARSNTRQEIAGVLLGEVNYQRNTVLVHAAIAAEHTQSSRGNVTFTHDTWAQINAVVDAEYSDQAIVGWYHSHPDFGIFLSNYDTFIHQNFFSAQWQIAYVVDPVRQEEGCFVWENGELVRVPDVKLYMNASDYNEASEMEQPKLPEAFTAGGESVREAYLQAGQKWALGILAVLVAMTVLLQVYALGEILRLRDEIAGTGETVAAIKADLGVVRSAEADVPVGEPTMGPDIAAPPGAVLPCDIYEVTPGDTLQAISEKFYETPDNAQMIAIVNDLGEDEQLMPETKLLIPQLPEPEDEADEAVER